MLPEFVSGRRCHDHCDVLVETLIGALKLFLGCQADGINGLIKSLRVRHDNTKLRTMPSAFIGRSCAAILSHRASED